MNLFGLYGVSGFGREVMPVARATLARDPNLKEWELVFVDDAAASPSINGHRVMTFEQFPSCRADGRFVNIAIADSKVRETIWNRCADAGVKPFTIAADNASFLDNNVIGPGAIFCAYSMVTSNARIGRGFHANIYSYVAHDCVVGDFVTFAPNVQCNGNIVIEDHAYIGTNATLRQGAPGKPLVIGRGAIVGMGAVVTKSVPAGATVVGNPARVLER